MAELSGRFRELQNNVLSSSASTAILPQSHSDRKPEPHANNPPLYDGDPNSCRAFLSQCSLVFALQPRRYATERLKIAYVITLLTGRAREWGTAVWDTGASFCNVFDDFHCEMTLRQGGRSVTDYAIQFKTLAASCDWNEGALRAMFREGLNFEIQDEIATHELPLDLEGFINLAIRVESCLRLRQRRLAPRSSWGLEEVQSFKAQPPPQSPLPDPEPMQLGRLRLSAQERQQRLVQGLCLYCGKQGHYALSCPLEAKAH